MKWIYSIAHGIQQLSVAWTFGIIFFSVVTNDVAGESSQKSYSAYSEHPQSNSHLSQDVKHIHLTNKEWTKSTVLPWDANKLEQPNIVPLALKDETFKQTKQSRSLHHEGNGSSNKNAKGSSKGDKKSSKKSKNSSQQYDSDHSSSSSSKGHNGKSHESKSHRYSNMESESSGLPDDLPSLQEKTLSLGKLVLEFLRQEVLPRIPGELSSMGVSSRSQERSMPFIDTFASLFNKPTKRQGEGGGEGGGVINRNQAIGWLARLIGVDGKTLGEFLREYQVHVLYDLVFTFFKWIFFLYAGLLIP